MRVRVREEGMTKAEAAVMPLLERNTRQEMWMVSGSRKGKEQTVPRGSTRNDVLLTSWC